MKYITILLIVAGMALAGCAKEEPVIEVGESSVEETVSPNPAQMDITIVYDEGDMVQETEKLEGAIDAEAVAKEFAEEEIRREVERAEAIEGLIKQ